MSNFQQLSIGNWKSTIGSLYNACMLALAATAISATAAVAAGLQSMLPTGQWFGRTFTGLPASSRHLALTYDDGPNDPHTLRLLEVLAKHNVHATFFLIGSHVREHPQIVREISNAGHTLGNHTYTHPLLILKSKGEIKRQIVQCQKELEDTTGRSPTLFRPPFGGRRPAVLRIARAMGLQPIMWNVSGRDWNAPSAMLIERKITRQVRGGDVILLHDGDHKHFGADRSQTVIATDLLIARYQPEGYNFLTIPQMLNSK